MLLYSCIRAVESGGHHGEFERPPFTRQAWISIQPYSDPERAISTLHLHHNAFFQGYSYPLLGFVKHMHTLCLSCLLSLYWEIETF
jgi:hypothetical protein